MSRLQRVRANLRRAYDTGRESVRAARADARRGAGRPRRRRRLRPRRTRRTTDRTSRRRAGTTPRCRTRCGSPAAWSWRLIVVGVVGWALLRFIGIISIVVIPLAIALLLSALLSPAVGWLLRARAAARRWPPSWCWSAASPRSSAR